jgi:hypothetical protein
MNTLSHGDCGGRTTSNEWQHCEARPLARHGNTAAGAYTPRVGKLYSQRAAVELSKCSADCKGNRHKVLGGWLIISPPSRCRLSRKRWSLDSSQPLELELEFFLRPTVSRPVRLGIGPLFGTLGQILACSSFFG